ncbi:hypothetical protein [Flavobacterium phragmitis]|uniref:DUF4298 domain-containing protein n=1 Tax=Flavobacterium phragmitis TaxID=739143 RepID=A0A1I1RN40_9FLAO|nr:hypothetical protein [Flavobacterium phragmitis]SFD35407.1 hypothetical protein SAMN05216297_10758 [Flavobacterium phragmitis]
MSRDNMDNLWNEVIKVLQVVKSKITSEIDLLWTHYNSVEELRSEINRIDYLLKDKNEKGLELLGYLFAPTGTFQEISMQNEWIEEYINLSSEFDTLYKILKT